MSRYWPLLLLLLAVGAVLAFLAGNGEEPDAAFDVVADPEPAPYVPPELEGLPAEQREAYRRRQEAAAREREEKRETREKRPDPHLIAAGRVLAAEDATGIPGALVWWSFPSEPCPRLDAPFYSVLPGDAQGTGCC